jgi:superfamily II DNA or RNA helicase
MAFMEPRQHQRRVPLDGGTGGLDSKGLAALRLANHYRTGERDPVEWFYRPCLDAATSYARAVGYFRSTVFLIVGRAIVDFARRGGSMRLVCSPSIVDEDARAIDSGYVRRDEVIAKAISDDIDAMLATEVASYRAAVLATLIKVGALDIRLAVRSSATGIYHEKLGVFDDAWGHRVSFLGSANETWSAWHYEGNHESIEVFCDWKDRSEASRVVDHAAHFERLWNGEVNGLQTVKFPEAQRRRLIDFALADLDHVEKERIAEVAPRRKPLPHQVAAIEAWEQAGRRGIFEHATGSGKTFTALTAVKHHVSRGLPALILVPSQLLLEQWTAEVREELPESVLLLAGAGHVSWKTAGRLQAMTGGLSTDPRVIIATMQTAASDEFLRSTADGEHLMLVADEVHQIGSSFNSRAMAIRSGATLGLSATPQRYGDPDGTARVFARFGKVIEPKITLQDAIRAGRLVEYEYYPHVVHLNAVEADEWRKLSERIRKEAAKRHNDKSQAQPMGEFEKLLLIQRSRLAKKAQAKPGIAASVLGEHYVEGQRWLVYCEDSDQLRDVMTALTAVGVHPIEYHSSMRGDRSAAMDWFRRFGGVIVSIRCLDEGVDIPDVSHALILASSQNPRQFIQRRGRVLRKAPNKNIAVVHDAIVVPADLVDEPEQMSLLRAEMVRALEFANSAINRTAGAQLRAVATSLGVDLEDDGNIGVEEDEE